MHESQLPTWRDMFQHALENLDAARSAASEARDWLNSDWRPLGSALPNGAGDARIEVQDAIGRIKGEIDNAKGALYAALWADR